MKIVSVGEVRPAKDGRNFFVLGFRPSLGQRIVSRTFWEQYKRDAKSGELTQEKYWERISPTEAKAAQLSGEAIDGKKVTHTVEPYEIGGKMVGTYSTVIFPDETEETVFANQNHPIVDELTGEIRGKKRAVLAPEGEKEEEETEGATKNGAKSQREKVG